MRRHRRFAKTVAPRSQLSAGRAVTSSPQSASTAPEIRVRQEQLDASTIDGERKTVTALFADIKGSMELMEDLDPEEARAIWSIRRSS